MYFVFFFSANKCLLSMTFAFIRKTGLNPVVVLRV